MSAGHSAEESAEFVTMLDVLSGNEHTVSATLDSIIRSLSSSHRPRIEHRSSFDHSTATRNVIATLDSVVKSIVGRSDVSEREEVLESAAQGDDAAKMMLDTIVSSLVDQRYHAETDVRAPKWIVADDAVVELLDSMVDSIAGCAAPPLQAAQSQKCVVASETVLDQLDTIVHDLARRPNPFSIDHRLQHPAQGDDAVVAISKTDVGTDTTPQDPSASNSQRRAPFLASEAVLSKLDAIVVSLIHQPRYHQSDELALESRSVSNAETLEQTELVVKHRLKDAYWIIDDFPASALRERQYTKDNVPPTFLDMLPGELRNRIYRDVGFPRQRQNLFRTEEPYLAAALPSLRPEIHAMLFAEATFEVDVYSKFRVHSELVSAQRSGARGRRYGTGKLVIKEQSWLNRADSRAVRFHHIHMHICELDGYGICHVSLKNTKNKSRFVPRVVIHGIKSQHTKIRLAPTKERVLKYVSELRKHMDFPGFSLQHLQSIAHFFGDPERR